MCVGKDQGPSSTTDSLVDWLADWFIDWSIDRSVDWFDRLSSFRDEYTVCRQRRSTELSCLTTLSLRLTWVLSMTICWSRTCVVSLNPTPEYRLTTSPSLSTNLWLVSASQHVGNMSATCRQHVCNMSATCRQHVGISTCRHLNNKIEIRISRICCYLNHW